jgi:hypothetical protein
LKILEKGSKEKTVEVVQKTKVKVQKIERTNLMSREEIEKKEVDEFLKYHKISLNFVNK